MCVSGVGGVLGQRVPSRAAVESGSATDSPWPLLQDPSVGAKRPRPKDATRPSAQVHVSLKREQSQQALNISGVVHKFSFKDNISYTVC